MPPDPPQSTQTAKPSKIVTLRVKVKGWKDTPGVKPVISGPNMPEKEGVIESSGGVEASGGGESSDSTKASGGAGTLCFRAKPSDEATSNPRLPHHSNSETPPFYLLDFSSLTSYGSATVLAPALEAVLEHRNAIIASWQQLADSPNPDPHLHLLLAAIQGNSDNDAAWDAYEQATRGAGFDSRMCGLWQVVGRAIGGVEECVEGVQAEVDEVAWEGRFRVWFESWEEQRSMMREG